MIFVIAFKLLLLLGKEIGSDLREGKITLPIIKALTDAPEEIHALVAEGVDQRQITARAWDRITTHLHQSGAFDYCRDKAMAYATSARARLQDCPDGPYRDALELAVDFAVKRSH